MALPVVPALWDFPVVPREIFESRSPDALNRSTFGAVAITLLLVLLE